jgi:hypothetical protein
MGQKPLRYELRLTPEQWAEVDEWRRRQPDLPNRAEAIRRMIAIALKAEQKTRKPDEAPGK